jgi:hypothetical protein
LTVLRNLRIIVPQFARKAHEWGDFSQEPMKRINYLALLVWTGILPGLPLEGAVPNAALNPSFTNVISSVDSVMANNVIATRVYSTDTGNPFAYDLVGGMNVAAPATFTNGTTRPFGSLILTHHTIGFTATNQLWGGDGGERAQKIPKSSGVASDFRAITNFDSGLGFQFATDPSKGTLTNQLTGVYRVSVSASFYATQSDVYRLAVCTNGVVVPHLAFTSPGAALNGKVTDVTLNGSGLLTVGANTAIDLRMISYAQDETVRWFNVNVVVDEP